MPASLRLLAFIVLAGFSTAAAAGSGDRAGAFDHYVLALSWSPSYCASEAGRGDAAQCGPGRRFDFVVHGLWPQYRRGWPDFCPSRERWVPARRISAMLDIMPSRKLVIHQWRKHGTCSGLGQERYFAATREAFARLTIPARYVLPQAPVVVTPRQLIADFVATNRWLEPQHVELTCANRRDRARLRELRICLERDLSPRACGESGPGVCRADRLVLPPVRGGGARPR